MAWNYPCSAYRHNYAKQAESITALQAAAGPALGCSDLLRNGCLFHFAATERLHADWNSDRGYSHRHALRFRHTLANLSENGIACFECFGSLNNFTRRELLVFSQAKALFTKRNGSVFEFLWKDPQDRLVFRWAGSFAGEGIEPPRSHIFHALKAAESTWTSFLVEDATQQLARGGATHLTWTTPERNHTISREDMELFRCESGIFEITPSYKGEAKGFTGLKIATGQVGNLNALTGLLDRYFTT